MEFSDATDPDATTAHEVVEPSSGVEAAPEPDGPRAGRRLPGSTAHWVAALVLAVLLAVSGYDGWWLFGQHQNQVAAAQALDAANRFALALTTVDSATIDRDFAAVLDGSTGEFHDMYTKSSEELRRLLLENKAAAHGVVLDAAVKSATRTKAVVLLFIDQSVSNKSSPEPKLDRSRVAITMEKVDGRWLARDVKPL